MSNVDEEWKPSGRPQSTMARSLAAALDDAFMLDSEVDTLTNSIQYKQQMVTIKSRELEALEARIREAEGRLKSDDQPPSSGSNTNDAGDNPSDRQGTFDSNNNEKDNSQSPMTNGHHSNEGYTNASSSNTTNNYEERANMNAQRDPKDNKAEWS